MLNDWLCLMKNVILMADSVWYMVGKYVSGQPGKVWKIFLGRALSEYDGKCSLIVILVIF